jgi:DNA-directed RNA polymerase specialized sigma24 family protein
MATVARKGWVMDAAAFDALLERLGAERERAGERYEALRRRLISFFEWKGTSRPEDHADETLDRVMRRVHGGAAVEDLAAYVGGVARRLLLEVRREEQRGREAAAALPPASLAPVLQPPPAPAVQARLRGLEHCLGCLAAEDREVVLAYYSDGDEGRMAARRGLAGRLGVPPHVLRARVHRIRARLERCLRRRAIDGGSGHGQA